jgi:hypothetical protein
MAISSPQLARSVLATVGECGVTHAMLHGWDRLSTGELGTDIDIVTDLPVTEVIGRMRQRLSARDIHLIMLWPYDRLAVSSFWAQGAATEGAQLDISCDPAGLGKYGMLTGALLEGAQLDGDIWHISNLDSKLYEYRKRIVKGDRSRAIPLRQELNGSQAARARLPRIFRPEVARQLEQTLDGVVPLPRPRGRVIDDIGRVAARARRPVGHTVSVGRGHEAIVRRDVAARFSRFVPRTVVADRAWDVTAVLARAMSGLRPQISFVPAARGVPAQDPDPFDDVERWSREVVHILAERVSRQWL